MIEIEKIYNLSDLKFLLTGNPTSVEKISTDTRTINNGDLFLALVGENFDGNNYLEKAIESGAIGCIYTRSAKTDKEVQKLSTIQPNLFFIGVDNTEKYFQELAKFHHNRWREKNKTLTIGITGSNGKTTTKELLAGILEKLFPGKILFTSGNLNNHLGVPMTLFRLNPVHDICILEMGTNHPGEIPFLCKLGDPEAGIITNIGQSHLEFFGDEENVFKEKRSLFDYVNNKSGCFSVDGDNLYLKKLSGENLSLVGFLEGNIKLELTGTSLSFSGDLITDIEAPKLFGKHNFKNLALCVSLLSNLYPEKKQNIVKACLDLELPDNNRSQVIQKNNKTFYLDAYNANPSSMMASLETFIQLLNKENLEIDKTICILGDMNELGDNAPSYHEEIGSFLNSLGIKNAFFVGRYSEFYKKGFGENSECFSSTEELKTKWNNVAPDYTSAFLKGSRTLQLESLMALF